MSEIKVNSIKGVAASTAAITVNNTDGSCTANITNNLSNRNRVINGSMIVNQRASSYTATGEEYTLDRFEHRTGSGFTFDTTTTQDSSAPDGFNKSLKITPDSTQTPTGSHNGMIAQKIEADNLIGFASGTSSAKKFVLSFYAKSASQNNNHQYSVQLSKKASSGTYYYQNRSFTVTSSWQRFTIAFSADTSNNITTGIGEGARITWHLTAGATDIAGVVTSWTAGDVNAAVTGQSNFMDNTSNEFYLTGVQLEASDSDVATDFEHKSFVQELALCQRYFYKTGDIGTGDEWYPGIQAHADHGCFTVPGLPGQIDRAAPSLRFPVLMRVSGTATYYPGRNDVTNTVSRVNEYTNNVNETYQYAPAPACGGLEYYFQGISGGGSEAYVFQCTVDAEL
tara:strand:+ start:306 stop:1493 length:1188 start_codon:yes stop_codon:yes gene_type:complete